jgi:hypothetical protein
MFNSHKITHQGFDYDYVDSTDKVGKNLHHDTLESPIHKHVSCVSNYSFISIRDFSRVLYVYMTHSLLHQYF